MTAFLVAAGFSLIVTPVVRWIALSQGWISHSVGRDGRHPALMGGIGICLSLVAAAALVGQPGFITSLIPFWVGAMSMLGMGLLDDVWPLPPGTKFAAQAVITLVFLLLLAGQDRHPLGLWTPLLFVWIVGITNAVNLLDNMDGLAAGVGAIAAVGLALIVFGEIRSVPSEILMSLAGSLLGFLAYNFHPARIFLGDSGSHLVGFSLAALPLYGVTSSNPAARGNELWVLPLLLLVPICDTTYVTISRIRRGVSIFKGGKDHLSHRLLGTGLPQPVVAILFYGTTVLLGLLTWSLSRYP